MDRSDLIDAVKAHERLQREIEASSIIVWNSLAKTEPELAAEILKLFSTVEAAANWLTSRSRNHDGSPAQHVAEGRAAEVLSKVRQTVHGFVG